MEYFLKFLQSDKYFNYVLTSYMIAGFVILILKIYSNIKLKKLEKKYISLAGKNES